MVEGLEVYSSQPPHNCQLQNAGNSSRFYSRQFQWGLALAKPHGWQSTLRHGLAKVNFGKAGYEPLERDRGVKAYSWIDATVSRPPSANRKN